MAKNDSKIPAFDINAVKSGAQRVDNIRWWSAFESGDFVVGRLVKLDPKPEDSDDSGKLKATDASGEMFQAYTSAIMESALLNVPVGNVFMVQFVGKKQHPKNPKRTLKYYEVYDLGGSFPDGAPVPDYEAIAARIAEHQGARD